MDLKQRIVQYGPVNSVRRFIKLLLRASGVYFETFWYLVNELDEENIKSKMRNFDYSDVRRLTVDDFKTSFHKVFNEQKLDLITKRLNNDRHKGYGIFHDGHLIYSAWISTDKIIYSSSISKTTPIRSHQAILEDSYCDPDFRNKGLNTKMTLYRLSKIAEIGLTEAVSIVTVDNRPSLKTLLKCGFQRVKKISVIKILGRTFCTEKDVL